MSDTLQLSGLQQARLLRPSLLSGVCKSSCPLNWWCYPTTSSSIAPFSYCLQSFLASGSFPLSWLFASGGQSVGISASASILLGNIQGWFHLGLTACISLQSTGLSRVFSNTTVQKHQFFSLQRDKGTFLHCWWECKLRQSLWRTVSRFLKKLGNKTTKWHSNPTTGHILWGNHNWKGHMYPNIHRSNIDNSQDMEAT